MSAIIIGIANVLHYLLHFAFLLHHIVHQLQYLLIVPNVIELPQRRMHHIARLIQHLLFHVIVQIAIP